MVKTDFFWSSYDIYTFGEEEVYTGIDNLSACVCRFCGRSSPEVRFKKKNAHAIPEALGNKYIFCNDECLSCNSALSPIDKQLTEYLKFRRAKSKILNKKNKIIQVWGRNFYYDGPSDTLKISRLAILEERERDYLVKLEGAEPITHLGLYKAFAKIAIDLMPRSLVDEYRRTVEWIRGDFVPKDLPNVFYIYHLDSSVQQPLAKVLVRRDVALIPGLPKCIVELTLIDLTFFFIVPFGRDDKKYGRDDLINYMDCLLQRRQRPGRISDIRDKIDMEDRVGKFAHVKELIPKGECEIVDQKEFDRMQEKNPNRVDFPPFDPSLVGIITTPQVALEYLMPDVQALNRLRIEETIVNIVSESICPDIEQSVFCGLWDIEIQTLDGRETVLKAQCEVKVKHRCISSVCAWGDEEGGVWGEISPFLIWYMLDVACKRVEEITRDKLRMYDFSRLPEFLMESEGYILHIKERAEKSVMSGLR